MSTSTAATLVIDQHLAPNDVAAYVDRALTGERRARVEAHLARCAECRAELSDGTRIIASHPRTRWRNRSLVAACSAVAAALLIFVLPRAMRDSVSQHRESPVTSIVPPVLLSPTGARMQLLDRSSPSTDSIVGFTWSSVPHADRYRIRIFDTNGSILLERTSSDTTMSLPADVLLRAGQNYFWQVQADVGFDRHATSELVEFSLRPRLRQ